MLDGMNNIKAIEILKVLKLYNEDLPPYSPDEVAEAIEISIKSLENMSDKEIRHSIDLELSLECMKFTDEVLGILGTFGLPDIYVRRNIIDELFKHKDKYKKLCKLWDQIVGNFS